VVYNLDQKQFAKIKDSGEGFVFFKKISSDFITPVLSFAKLSQKYSSNLFLFESVEKGSNKGRFSVIGLDPDMIWKCQDNKSFINEKAAIDRNLFTEQKNDGKRDNINNLRNFINKSQINWKNTKYNNSQLPSICSGVFGYMGYDMVNHMEQMNNKVHNDDIAIPDSIFIRPQIIIVFDSLFDVALICAPRFKDSDVDYDILHSKIESVVQILEAPYSQDGKPISDIEFDFKSNYTQEQFCKIVEKCKDYIKSGDIFQVLPSQRFISDFPCQIDEFDFYRSLRSINPSPFLFYLKFDDFVITGSSPEIMASLKEKIVTIRPLAGTRERGVDKEEDQKIAQDLLHDKKEIAEHLMLIDLGRHDVGRVSKDGSVRVTEQMIIENYSHVMHISSNVEGILKDDCDALDVLISGFPAGTVSGAPKIRAMEIINEIEKEKRSFYAGCVGYFASNGDMETCITLRSALIKLGKIYLQAGAGVVFDSKPESEYQECINKAYALIKACMNIKNFNHK